MKKVVLLVTFLLVLIGASVASAGESERQWFVDLQPLNDSGVSGSALLSLEDGQLTVHIMASGLEAGQTHAQHIHGLVENRSNRTCPPPEADADGDGIVSVAEGLPFYGPVLLPLTPFQTAPAGEIDYTQTFNDLSALEPVNSLQNRVIVLHGLSIDGGYSGSTPVACGQIQPLPQGG